MLTYMVCCCPAGPIPLQAAVVVMCQILWFVRMVSMKQLTLADPCRHVAQIRSDVRGSRRRLGLEWGRRSSDFTAFSIDTLLSTPRPPPEGDVAVTM